MTPVYVPPCRVDAANIAQFRWAVAHLAGRHEGIVVDCTDVGFMSLTAMRVLEHTAVHSVVIVVNPSPVVHLLATVFGLDVVLPRFAGSARDRDHRRLRCDRQQPLTKVAGHVQTTP